MEIFRIKSANPRKDEIFEITEIELASVINMCIFYKRNNRLGMKLLNILAYATDKNIDNLLEEWKELYK